MAPPQIIKHVHLDSADEKNYEPEFNYRDIGTVRDVKKEMVLIYKLQRRGTLDSQEYGRLVNGLNVIANTIKDSDIEKRISDIEDLMKNK